MGLETTLNTLDHWGSWSKPMWSETDYQVNFIIYSVLGGCYSEVREPVTSAVPLTQAGLMGSTGAVSLSLLSCVTADSLFPPPTPLRHVPSIGASKPGQCWPFWFLLGLLGKEPLSVLHNKCRYLWWFVGRRWGKHLCLGLLGQSVAARLCAFLITAWSTETTRNSVLVWRQAPWSEKDLSLNLCLFVPRNSFQCQWDEF